MIEKTMKKLLFITSKNPESQKLLSGGLKLSAMNIQLLRRSFSVDIVAVYPKDSKGIRKILEIASRIFQLLLGQTHFLTPTKRKILVTMAKNYDVIFLDYSLYGKIARDMRKSYPDKTIVTHFHNVESLFANSASNLPPPFNLLQAYLVNKAELFACIYSNKLFFLSERDADYFSNFRDKACICPPAIPDQYKNGPSKQVSKHDFKVLFCGTYFKPNVEGISWFIENVLSRQQQGTLDVVGLGMDRLRDTYQRPNLNIIGAVEEIEPYYANTDIVISPIFSGSGMKIKSIEALMHNKPLIGTSEALIGIPTSVFIRRADTADQFIDAMSDFRHLLNQGVAVDTRSVYLNYFNPESRATCFATSIENA